MPGLTVCVLLVLSAIGITVLGAPAMDETRREGLLLSSCSGSELRLPRPWSSR